MKSPKKMFSSLIILSFRPTASDVSILSPVEITDSILAFLSTLTTETDSSFKGLSNKAKQTKVSPYSMSSNLVLSSNKSSSFIAYAITLKPSLEY